jgi:hypothetical protein
MPINPIYSYFIPQPIIRTLPSSGKNDLQKISMENANNTPIMGLPSILDSFIRGAGRYYETNMENYANRIGFRFITENVRYLSSRSLLHLFQKQIKEINLNMFLTGIRKSLEITMGTAIVDPNRQIDKFKRMGTGFLNMFARLGSRIGLIGIGVLKASQFDYKTLSDEFLSRTLCRLLFIDTENPIVGVGCRTVEQFAINEWVRSLPFYNLVISKLPINQRNSNSANANGKEQEANIRLERKQN